MGIGAHVLDWTSIVIGLISSCGDSAFELPERPDTHCVGTQNYRNELPAQNSIAFSREDGLFSQRKLGS